MEAGVEAARAGDAGRQDYADEKTTDTALTRHNDPAGHITPPST